MLKRVSGLFAALCIVAGCAGEPHGNSQIEAIMGEDVLEGIEQRVGGRLGVALTDQSGNLLRAYRGDERFAMCSTFKLSLSAAVLERVETGDMALDDGLAFGEADLLDYAPAAAAFVEAGEMSVGEAAEAIVTLSDNTAANLLLAEIGGPEGMTAFSGGTRMKSPGSTGSSPSLTRMRKAMNAIRRAQWRWRGWSNG